MAATFFSRDDLFRFIVFFIFNVVRSYNSCNTEVIILWKEHIKERDYELDRSSDGNNNLLVFLLIESVCKCCGLGDELVQFCVMKVLLSAIRSPFVEFRGN
ncbi:uncharacterized protein LOC110692744 isoform X2 [Chenopodium quinoa]|uniref:uncharacterized protein LOC110692733 isoform X2 n=1 Tax=Chenopodium quinoa TaxID=63459 RepID=UPI000B7864B5|nr:uncharacterized protein LOC110692733 isoform X2 [Chenopodium quinoa]XP_021725487.1 uncharacterized protein LOC110692744 isoform X2 [Chenopodium quinoa]